MCSSDLNAVDGADAIFYLIGNSTPNSSNADPAREIRDSFLASAELFDICKNGGAGHIVFASSGGTVYGPARYLPIDEAHVTAPICAYGINKLATEHYMRLYARLHRMNMVVARIANPYGPRQSIQRGQGIEIGRAHV